MLNNHNIHFYVGSPYLNTLLNAAYCNTMFEETKEYRANTDITSYIIYIIC